MDHDVACIVCGNKNYTLLYAATFSGSVDTAAKYFLSHRKEVAHGQIVRCRNCEFVYTTPQFKPTDYDKIYQQVSSNQSVIASSFQTAEKLRFTRLSSFVRQYIVDNGRFFDFGCGSGGFLDVMNNEHGFGFEVGLPSSCQSSSGYKIIKGNFFDLVGKYPFENESFNFVTAFDVLEHLADLPRYIEALQNMIQKGGYIVVTVPNVESRIAKLTGERWNMILLEHLWYFSPKTLQQLFESFGFIHIATDSMPYDTPVSHLINRVSQTYQITIPELPKCISSRVLPMPIGLMASVFKRL